MNPWDVSGSSAFAASGSKARAEFHFGATAIASDGRSVRGIERAIDEFHVVIQDFSGKVHSFDRASPKSARRDDKSLMPSYAALPAGELDDLLKYLLSLGARETRP